MVALAEVVKEKARIYYSTKGKWPEPADAAEAGLDVLAPVSVVAERIVMMDWFA